MSQLSLQSQFSQFSGRGKSFPNPFNDIASLSQPINMRSALYWAEYIMSTHGSMRQAFERIGSSYLNDVLAINMIRHVDQPLSKLADMVAERRIKNMVRKSC